MVSVAAIRGPGAGLSGVGVVAAGVSNTARSLGRTSQSKKAFTLEGQRLGGDAGVLELLQDEGP